MEQNNNSQDTFNTEVLDTEEKDIQEDYGDGFGEENDNPMPLVEPKEKNKISKKKDDKKQHNDSKKSVIIAVSSGAVVLIIIIVTLFTVLSFSKRDNTEETQETTISLETFVTKETETETKGDNPQTVVTNPVYTTVATQPTTEPTTEPTTVATTVATEPPTETEAKTEPTVIDTTPQENTVNQDNPIV